MTEYNHELNEKRFSDIFRAVEKMANSVSDLVKTVDRIEFMRENDQNRQAEIVSTVNTLQRDVNKALRATETNTSAMKMRLLIIGAWVSAISMTAVTGFYALDFLGMIKRPDTALESKIDSINRQIEDLKKQDAGRLNDGN